MKKLLAKVGLSLVLALVALMASGTGSANAQLPGEAPDIELTWGVGEEGQPTLRWGAGGCVGDFHDPQQINNKMQWGAETHCSGNGWTPHQLELILEQKEVVDNWFDTFHEVAWIGSKPYQMGSPNISITEHWRDCDDVDNTDYRIIAKLTAGSHKKTTISDEYTVNCLYDSTV